MIKPFKIVLPESAPLKKNLKKKLNEYEKRVSLLKKKIYSSNPELSYISMPGFKALITRRLYQRGEVNTQELAQELIEEYGRVNYEEFNTAASVIDDYCKTGGKKVKKVPLKKTGS
ncbi:MAG: hypothetical protein R2860_15910 [Desulfobacterales bacterium]|jgi:hypothetical protein